MVLTLVAIVVAIAAAVRSTWSPCGLSMLATVTPLAERGRGYRYRSTAAWFVLGSVAGGATLGAAMAVLAVGIHALALSPLVVGIVATAAAVVAAGSDADVGGHQLPVHHRQVNERWLDRFRPWVYGAGFGWQIGTGLATYIMTAAVYLTIVLGALTGSPLAALATALVFGLVRGVAVLLGRRITTPEALVAFHRRFFELGRTVGTITLVVEATAVVALAWLVSPWAAVVLALAFGATAVVRIAGRRRGSAATVAAR